MYRPYKVVVFSILPALILSISACSHHPDEAAKDARFEVTDTLLRSLVIDTVKAENAVSEITLTGSIAPDESKMVKIFPMVSGIAQSVHVQLGDVVKKGQVLTTLRSAEIAGFSRDLISAQADLRNAKRQLETTQDLYKSGLSSEKDLEQAKSDYQKATAENNRAGSIMSINKSNGKGYEIQSPLTGYVIEKNVTEDMQVRADNNQNLFTIADLSSVFVLINMYESDIASVKLGDAVQITTLAYPDKVFTGKIDKLFDVLDPDNKVMRARVMISNPDNMLKPGMFTNVKIQAKSGMNLPAIKTDAIVFDNNKNYVVVVDGPAKVHIQLVEIAKRVEDVAYISKGLKPGQRVVASRQVYLYESLKE
ncbi:efflux RND transporter periplasmic adaptor subunit [Mucilaginibacter ginsenosidivorax]|uniref:Efflux RND transporter periplasmic adaptor subunit n=1 Tax=Mucilaginibacter ginsenosidivorax TaxID=862126 RepID=A0A5B8VUK4_9SPHI|nr:efflux RND transporter periplasmic adaptor subunit [Mucilaginibacter ginsenosidivorax]QEC74446.1 efflux RND transporter periplasmic adaptor subunit [Mucilaginibacter ginsenosidivorax]